MNKRSFIKNIFYGVNVLLLPTPTLVNENRIKNDNANQIKLFYSDVGDDDKIKPCGLVQSIPNIFEKRNYIGGPIYVNGECSRIILHSSSMFYNNYVNSKSQTCPFIAKYIQNNIEIIINFMWLKNVDFVYQSENSYILEGIDWEAESIKLNKNKDNNGNNKLTS